LTLVQIALAWVMKEALLVVLPLLLLLLLDPPHPASAKAPAAASASLLMFPIRCRPPIWLHRAYRHFYWFLEP
jgi:hypothetical protein